MTPSRQERIFFLKRMNDAESSSVHPSTLPAQQGLHGGSSLPCDAGVSPSTPTEPCNSNKEASNAFAAAHPNRPHHLIRHACSARFLMSAVSLLARALASSVVNPLVSRENLPPTSSKNDQPRPAPRSKELWVTLFLALPDSQECHAVSFRGAPPLSTISMQSAHQRGVHCQLCTAMQWETVDHDLQSASVLQCCCRDVHVPHMLRDDGHWGR